MSTLHYHGKHCVNLMETRNFSIFRRRSFHVGGNHSPSSIMQRKDGTFVMLLLGQLTNKYIHIYIVVRSSTSSTLAPLQA